MNDKRQETAKQEKQELQPGKMGEERERERERGRFTKQCTGTILNSERKRPV